MAVVVNSVQVLASETHCVSLASSRQLGTFTHGSGPSGGFLHIVLKANAKFGRSTPAHRRQSMIK